MSPKDRDLRSTSAPPPDSPAARALATAGTPDRGELERQARVARDFINEDSKPHATPLESLERTAGKSVAQATIAASETGLLRMEMREDISKVNDRVDELGDKVSDLHGDVREIKGAFGELNRHLEEQRDERKIRVTTEVELQKAAGMADIDERKANGATRRAVIGKVVGWLIGTGGTVGFITMLAQRGC